MPRSLHSLLAATVATASLIATVPAAQAAQPDPNEPIICVRCGVTSIQLPGWVVNPPIKQINVVHP
jgi:hypothetical protein